MLVAFAPNTTIHSHQLVLIASEHLVPLFSLAAIVGLLAAQEARQSHAAIDSVICCPLHRASAIAMSDTNIYRASTTAPVNIAVVKYVQGIDPALRVATEENIVS